MSFDRLTPALLEEVKSIYTSNISLLFSVNTKDREEVYKKVKELLYTAFDIPEEAKTIRYKFTDRDLLWISPNNEENNYNYYQLTSTESNNHSVNRLASYLFDTIDPFFYNNPFQFSEEELKDRELLYSKIRSKYINAKQYLQRVKRALLDSEDFCEYYENLVQKVVFDSENKE